MQRLAVVLRHVADLPVPRSPPSWRPEGTARSTSPWGLAALRAVYRHDPHSRCETRRPRGTGAAPIHRCPRRRLLGTSSRSSPSVRLGPPPTVSSRRGPSIYRCLARLVPSTSPGRCRASVPLSSPRVRRRRLRRPSRASGPGARFCLLTSAPLVLGGAPTGSRCASLLTSWGLMPFEVVVLQLTFAIPVGRDLLYGRAAEEIGRPRAARLVVGSGARARTRTYSYPLPLWSYGRTA